MHTSNDLRVAFYLDTPHRLAGAQRQLQLFLRWARPAGLHARVAAPMGGICVDAFRADGVPVDIIAAPENLRRYGKQLIRTGPWEKVQIWFRDVLPHSRDVAAWAQAQNARLLHFNAPRGVVAAGIAARGAGLRPVLHLRGTFAYFDGAFRWASQILSDRIYVNAEALRSQVYEPFRDRCIAIHDGVEGPKRWRRDEARAALSSQLGLVLGDKDRLVLSLSSFVPFKGLHHLLAAAAQVRDSDPSVRFTVICAGTAPDPQYRTYLASEVARLRLNNVKLIGYFSDPELLTVAADVLVLSTIDNTWFQYPNGERVAVRSTEGLPQAVLEALAAGVPVVATRVAGTPEQIREGETGFLVPQGDAGAMAVAIRRILRDENLRLRMGHAARDDAAIRFDARTQSLRTLDLLREAAG